MTARRAFGRFVAWLASFDASLEVNRINNRWPVSDGKWCDYCSCEGCQLGLEADITGPRYECADGTHICHVCFAVEPCVNGITRRGSVFCADHPRCRHKPKLKEAASG